MIVPVLSEQMTSQQPKVSTACIFLTMAFCLLSSEIPKLIMIVITAGILSGMAATDIATAVKNAFKISSGRATTSKMNVIPAINKIK